MRQPSRARIAYCSPLRGDAFAVGLQFPSAVDDSVKSRRDMMGSDPFSPSRSNALILYRLTHLSEEFDCTRTVQRYSFPFKIGAEIEQNYKSKPLVVRTRSTETMALPTSVPSY